MEAEKNNTLTGTVQSVTFRNGENGFTVMRLNVGNELKTVVGSLPEPVIGETLRIFGEWGFHQTFGEQFVAQRIEQLMPVNESAVVKYLSSGIIKGLGEVTARRLVEKFGMESLNIIETSPERLTEIKGITVSRAQQISSDYRRRRSLRDLMLRLGGAGLTISECMRVYNIYGEESAKIITANPYLICSREIGVSFTRADVIAAMLNPDTEELPRDKAGIIHILRHNLFNGHTCIPTDALYAPASNLLDADRAETDGAVSELCADGDLIRAEIGSREFLFLKEAFEAERNIAEKIRLLSLFSERSHIDISESLKKIEHDYGIRYDDIQKNAIETSVSKGLLIMTGGPGTGKTTTLRAIIRLLEEKGEKVLLTAPTGRAAKRMTQLTGHEGVTIHRLLEAERRDGEEEIKFNKNADNPLKADAVIVDELSMVDIFLFSALLDALPASCTLILVGDSDQLPPVGAGNVLNDLIASGVAPTVKLTKIFRQSEKSLIVTNAHLIVQGKMPVIDNSSRDFFFLPRSDAVLTRETIVSLCATRLPKAYGFSPVDDIQVLCPSRLGDAGTNSLNLALREVINPPGDKPEMKYISAVFREGDKVMQTKNDYDTIWYDSFGKEGTGIFNGDIGVITEIDTAGDTLTIQFDDRTATIPHELLQNIELAYAVTVHKSQGNEFDTVILPICGASPQLRYRNLLYTAVTRAKKLIVLVGRASELQSMVENTKKTKRYSALKYLLVQNNRQRES